jgi:hypothetical protein
VDFQIITDVSVAGDTIVVLDGPEGPGPDRVIVLHTSHFRPNAATRPAIARMAVLPPGHRAWQVLRAGDQWVLFSSRNSRAEAGGTPIFQRDLTFQLFTPSRGLVSPPLLTRTLRNPIALLPPRNRIIHPLFQTEWVPAAGQGGVYVADSAAMSVETYGVDGSRKANVRVAQQPVSVSPQMVDAYVRDLAAARRDTGNARALPPPATFPAVNRFWVSHDGSIAIERKDLQRRPWSESDSVVVQIMSPAGVDVGRAVLPPQFEIKDFNSSRLYGLLPDSTLLLPPRPFSESTHSHRVLVVRLAIPASQDR